MGTEGSWRLAENIIQNILFYVPQKKESHAGLEWHEGDFLGVLSLYQLLHYKCID